MPLVVLVRRLNRLDFLPWHDSGRYPDCGYAIRQICTYQRPGTNNTPGPDTALRHNRGADANEGALPNDHVTTQVHTGRNMSMVSNAIVMVYCAASV